MAGSSVRNTTAGSSRALKSIAALLPALGLVLCSGLLVSLYVVAVNQLTARRTDADCVRQAALLAAKRLSLLVVDDDQLGKIGIADQPANDGTRAVTSLNRVYATLLLDKMLSRRLQLPCMNRLVQADWTRAHRAETLLRRAMLGTIASGEHPESGGMSLSDEMTRLVNDAKLPGESLVSLKVYLGYLRPQQYDSGVPAYQSPETTSLVLNGRYKPGLAVTSDSDLPVYFYELPPQTQLSDARYFATGGSALPTTVLVRAVLNRTTGSQSGRNVQLTACATVGGIIDAPSDSVFMVSMPYGVPPHTHALIDLLNTVNSEKGSWQQASGGDVPGSGKLAPAGDVGGDSVPASDAVQMALYNWLRALGPNVDPGKLHQMLAYPWPAAADNACGKSAESLPNSALTMETGARAFAFAMQSGPGGSGQQALRNAFACNPSLRPFPPSALSLQVDADGGCHLAGRKGFNQQLVADFLQSLYETHLAALESRNAARLVSQRMRQALEENRREYAATSEEMRSVDTAISLLNTRQPADGTQVRSLQKERQRLGKDLQRLKSLQTEYQRVQSRATLVVANGDKTLQSLFDLATNLNTRLRGGLFYCRKPDGFLVGNELVFVPKKDAADEAQLYAAQSAQEASSASWFNPAFNVMQHTTSDTIAEGHPLAELASLLAPAPAQPLFVIFDGESLLKGKRPKVTVLTQSPFAGGGIDEGQLAYYAPDALHSPGAPPISWSLLIRDLVAVNAFGGHFLPRADFHGAASHLDVIATPLLAVEVQVRSPRPVLPDLPIGSSLVNPSTHERVPLLPPTPPSML